MKKDAIAFYIAVITTNRLTDLSAGKERNLITMQIEKSTRIFSMHVFHTQRVEFSASWA